MPRSCSADDELAGGVLCFACGLRHVKKKKPAGSFCCSGCDSIRVRPKRGLDFSADVSARQRLKHNIWCNAMNIWLPLLDADAINRVADLDSELSVIPLVRLDSAKQTESVTPLVV
jgi:hypothetical protein